MLKSSQSEFPKTITKEIPEKKSGGAPNKIPKEFQMSFLNKFWKTDEFLEGTTSKNPEKGSFFMLGT